MRFETFIGRRHLFGRERRLRMRLTALIAVVSVAVGVAALITVIAVLDGLDASLHQRYMDMIAHIEALPPVAADLEIFDDSAAVAETLAADPRVEAVAPLVRREVFLMPDREHLDTSSAVQLLGVDPAQTRAVAGFVDRTVMGVGEPGPDEIVLGQLLALHILGVRPGDTVWAITRFTIDAHAVPHFRWAELRVVGLFVSGVPELDMQTAYVNIETARRIAALPDDAVSAYQIRTADSHRANSTARAIADAHPTLGARLRSWDQTNTEFFQALWLEKMGTAVMLLMIVLVASFNIAGTLVMIVTERTREIGILKTMGASDPVVRRIFLRSGLLIGSVGTALGVASGLGLCAIIGKTDLINVEMMLYDLNRLPVLIHWPTVLLIAAAAMFICLVASVLPAQTAARLNPVEALRRE